MIANEVKLADNKKVFMLRGTSVAEFNEGISGLLMLLMNDWCQNQYSSQYDFIFWLQMSADIQEHFMQYYAK